MVTFIKILIALLAYIIGSIPFGLLLGKIKKIDVRSVGSHNIGAANTGRALGKKYAVITFLLDMIKGSVFVILFRYKIISNDYMILSPALYGFLAILGHSFSIFLKFKGGKGVATGAGVLFSYLPLTILIGLFSFVLIVKLTHIASISSLISTLIVTIIAIVMTLIGKDFVTGVDIDIYLIYFSLAIMALIYIRHIPNIKRLLQKKENKV